MSRSIPLTGPLSSSSVSAVGAVDGEGVVVVEEEVLAVGSEVVVLDDEAAAATSGESLDDAADIS